MSIILISNYIYAQGLLVRRITEEVIEIDVGGKTLIGREIKPVN